MRSSSFQHSNINAQCRPPEKDGWKKLNETVSELLIDVAREVDFLDAHLKEIRSQIQKRSAIDER